MAVKLTGGNRHDVTQLIPLVDSIPPIAGKVGRPIRRPKEVFADRAYDSDPHRADDRGAEHRARQRPGHLPVVERTISWLYQFRRLRIRYERRADIHTAFLVLGCILICHRYWKSSFC